MNFFDARNSTSAVAPEPSSSVTISPWVRGGRSSVSSTAVHAASSPTLSASRPMSLSDQVRIKRDSDTATEVIGGTMPLVLSVTDQTGEARYPSFKGIMAAKKKPMETYALGDLGVDADEVGLSVAWSEVLETAARPPRTAGEIVTDEDGSGAVALTEFLVSKKFV